MTQPIKTIDVLIAEHAELERALADPDLHSIPPKRAKPDDGSPGCPDRGDPPQLVSASGDLDTARELPPMRVIRRGSRRIGIRVAESGHPTYRHAVAARPA